MEIFISWSGDRSNIIAVALKSWIENFFQNVEVFMSQSDIEPGTRWASRLNERLEKSNFGIICLTPENFNSQWILFESGALSKQVEGARLIPFLFQLKKTDVSGPLSQFQSVMADENGVRELVRGININLERPLSTAKLDQTFQVWWHKLAAELEEVPKVYDKQVADKRPDRELLEEVLQYTRNQTLKEARNVMLRKMTERDFKEMDKKALVNYMQDALSRTTEGVAPSEVTLMKKQIVLAATVLKENFPETSELVEKLISNLNLK